MSFFLTELRRPTSDLTDSGFEWCLVGGLAASVYVEPRTTKDVDVAVTMRSEDEMAELRSFLISRGYSHPTILMRSFPTRPMGWRLLRPRSRATEVPVDILTAACSIEDKIVRCAVKVELLPALTLPVAALGHLIAMKVLSHNDTDRLQDRVDVISLIRVATTDNMLLAEQALRQISERGFSNERNLIEELWWCAKVRASKTGQAFAVNHYRSLF